LMQRDHGQSLKENSTSSGSSSETGTSWKPGTPSLMERRSVEGEIHFRWILEGRAVQDVWSMIDEKTGNAIPAGTTVRFYDSNIDAWHSIWISPRQRVVQSFLARRINDEIVLEGKTPDGRCTEKWVFSEIKPNSFKWHSEETHDGGKTWILTEEMRVHRKKTRG
jgi:hypothetical protein